MRSRKGLTVPGGEGMLDPFTPADAEILDLTCRLGAELVAVLFVRTGTDISRVRDALDGQRVAPLLIAKVATHQAVEHIRRDGVMVSGVS